MTIELDDASAAQNGVVKLRPALLPITCAYLAVVAVLMVVWHIGLSPDVLLIALLPIGIMTGQFVRWLGDWIPFVVLLTAWEGLRSFALKAGAPPHSGALRLELFVFRGHVPTVVLQSALNHGLIGRILGLAATGVYIAHFAMTLGIGICVWLRNRRVFVRYVVALLSASFAAFIVFLLVPTAPPWFASLHGYLPGVTRILVENLPPAVSPLFGALEPNQFAALPSMHAAYPFLGFLAARQVDRRLGWFMGAWCVVVWFCIVYLGEHYVLDAVAGVAFAYGAWAWTARQAAAIATWSPGVGVPRAL